MLFGVVLHTERADADFARVDGGYWVGSADFKSFPHDPPQSDDGILVAKKVAQRITAFAQDHDSCFHVVMTSPLKRCVQTALEIRFALGQGWEVSCSIQTL